MKRSIQALVLGVTGLIFAAALLRVVVQHAKPGHVAVPNSTVHSPLAISKPPRVLGNDEVEELMTQEFQLVYQVQQIPDVVRDSFVNFVDWDVEGTLAHPETKRAWEQAKKKLPSLQMADPGQRMNDDFIEEGVPNRRLVFCGYSDTAAFVLYQQGGYVDTERLVVFSFAPKPGAWQAYVEDYETATLAAIQDVLHRHRYKIFLPIPPIQNPV